MRFNLVLGLAGLLLLTGCVSAPQSAALLRQASDTETVPLSVANLPFFPQDEFACGPAALATLLVASGIDTSPEDLLPLVYVPERKGSFQVEIVAAARSFDRLAYTVPPQLAAVVAEVRNGTPVLVLQNLGLAAYPKWHYAVVKGFDFARGRVLLNSGVLEDYSLALATFERTWTRAGNWALVVMEPGRVPAAAEPTAYFKAVVALELAGYPDSARRAYQSGLERWPEDRDLLMAHGNLLYGAGELRAATAAFRSVTQQHPDYAPAHNNLAQVLFEQGELDQALLSARQALALGGAYSATYQDTLQLISSASVGP